MLREKSTINVNRSSSKKQASVDFVQNVHDAHNKYKKRVEGEALQNLDEAPESQDIDRWEVISVDLDHNPAQKITSLTNLPTDKNEYHELGTIPIQATPQTTSSSSVRKNLGQQFLLAAGDGGAKGTGGGSTGENKLIIIYVYTGHGMFTNLYVVNC